MLGGSPTWEKFPHFPGFVWKTSLSNYWLLIECPFKKYFLSLRFNITVVDSIKHLFSITAYHRQCWWYWLPQPGSPSQKALTWCFLCSPPLLFHPSPNHTEEVPIARLGLWKEYWVWVLGNSYILWYSLADLPKSISLNMKTPRLMMRNPTIWSGWKCCQPTAREIAQTITERPELITSLSIIEL